jgi:hypothetical protein
MGWFGQASWGARAQARAVVAESRENMAAITGVLEVLGEARSAAEAARAGA